MSVPMLRTSSDLENPAKSIILLNNKSDWLRLLYKKEQGFCHGLFHVLAQNIPPNRSLIVSTELEYREVQRHE